MIDRDITIKLTGFALLGRRAEKAAAAIARLAAALAAARMPKKYLRHGTRKKPLHRPVKRLRK